MVPGTKQEKYGYVPGTWYHGTGIANGHGTCTYVGTWYQVPASDHLRTVIVKSGTKSKATSLPAFSIYSLPPVSHLLITIPYRLLNTGTWPLPRTMSPLPSYIPFQQNLTGMIHKVKFHSEAQANAIPMLQSHQSKCEADCQRSMEPKIAASGSDENRLPSFPRMLLDIIAQHPEQMQKLLLPSAPALNTPSQDAVAQTSSKADFLAFTAVLSAIVLIDHYKDHQPRVFIEGDGTFARNRGNSQNGHFDDASVDDCRSSLEHDDSFHSHERNVRESSYRRAASFTRGGSVRRFNSVRSFDSYDNQDFDFGAVIKIACLEDQVDDMEEEILELREEIKKHKYRTHHLVNELNLHKSVIFDLEDVYAELKVDLAAAQSALDDQVIATQEVLCKRDLQMLEVSLEINSLAKEKNAMAKQATRMQKMITRLEQSIDNKDQRYKKLVEELEQARDESRALTQQLDYFLQQQVHQEGEEQAYPQKDAPSPRNGLMLRWNRPGVIVDNLKGLRRRMNRTEMFQSQVAEQ